MSEYDDLMAALEAWNKDRDSITTRVNLTLAYRAFKAKEWMVLERVLDVYELKLDDPIVWKSKSSDWYSTDFDPEYDKELPEYTYRLPKGDE